jgi:DNA-binding MarR family transcriptional regulator
MLQNLKKLLSGIGLAEKETEVLFILLQHDAMKASDLARKTQLNRTTLYGILKALTNRGLVSSRERFGVTEYLSLDPSLLPSFLEQQREKLRSQQEEIQQMLPELSKMRDVKRGIPKFQFFEGWDGLKQAYEDTLENNKGKKIWDFTGPEIISANLDPVFLEYYMQKRAKLGIVCEQVAPEGPVALQTVALDEKYLRHTLLIPKEFGMETEFILYDNKVAMLSFNKDRPLAVIIEDESIVDSLKTVFRYVVSTVK